MKKWKSGLTACLAAAAGVGYYFSNRLLYIKKKDDPFILKREMDAKQFHPEEFNRLPKEEFWISSPFGYSLKAVLIRPYPHKKFMIFCHGVTENKISSIKYLNLFLKLGFNGVIYDHRRHGESGGKTTSYGFYEKHDLKAVVDELIKREGDGVFFGSTANRWAPRPRFYTQARLKTAPIFISLTALSLIFANKSPAK